MFSNIKLIDEARSAWRFASVWISGFLAIMALLQANFGIVTMFVPAAWLPWLVATIAIAAIIGRLLKQPGPSLEGKLKKYDVLFNQIAELIAKIRGNPDLSVLEEQKLLQKIEEKKVEKDLVAAKISIESKQTIDLPIAPTL